MTSEYPRRITFKTPYDQYGNRDGQECTVLRKLPPSEIGDYDEVGDMYRVRFDDGEEIDAWPEEIGTGLTLNMTLVLLKPDADRRGLLGTLIKEIEKEKHFRIKEMRMVRADRELLTKHYADHQGKEMFEPLIKFMLSGPIVAMKVVGPQALARMRSLAGPVGAVDDETLRGRYHVLDAPLRENLIHTSGSDEEAIYELKLWFGDDQDA
jgi:nucleoside-diphosphate kinase